jgi:sporulation protein YlmC with PRC-barrel domain
MREINSADLNGKTIVSQDGRRIGRVESVFVDVDNWEVSAVEVKLRRDKLQALELRRPLFGTQTIRIPTDQIAGVGDTIVLRTKLTELSFIGGSPAIPTTREREEMAVEQAD